MANYQLDLDQLKNAKEAYQSAAEKLSADMDTLNQVVNNTGEDIYEGIDGDTFRMGVSEWVATDFTEVYDTVKNIGTALENGLSDGKACKKLCHDFINTLADTDSGKSAEDMKGMLYCDQGMIIKLKSACTAAVSHALDVRTGADELDDILSELKLIQVDSARYTNLIREECDKVERLEPHSMELTAYAAAVESADDALKSALTACAPFGSYSLGVYEEDYAQANILIELLNKPAEDWTEEDKETWERTLRTLQENGEIDELEKVTEAVAASEGDVWNDYQAKTMSKIYTYGMENGNPQMVELVLNGMVQVSEVDGKLRGSINRNRSSAVLAQISPEEEGKAFYTLARVSHYGDEQSGSGSIEDLQVSVTESNGEFQISIKLKGNETKLSSVDMNEVVGEEGVKNLTNLGFEKVEINALLSSIYTDEDILFVGDLAKASTESDYYEVFWHEPDELGIATTEALYHYSYSLLTEKIELEGNWEIKSQDLSQFERFVNGLMRTEGLAGAGTKQYLTYLAAQGSLQLDSITCVAREYYNPENQISEAEKEKAIDALIPNYEWNAKLYGLYASFLCRREEEKLGLKGMGNYVQLSGLDLNSSTGNLLDANFSYYETAMYPDGNGNVEVSPIARPAFMEIKVHSGNDSYGVRETMNLIEAEKERRMAVPKSIIETGVAITSVFQPWAGVALGTAAGIAFGDEGEVRSATADAIHNINNQLNEGNVYAKSGIKGLSGIADTIWSYQKADEKVKNIQNNMETALYGDAVSINGHVVVAEGVLTSNNMLKKLELETNGLSFMADEEMKTAVTNELEQCKKPDDSWILSTCYSASEDNLSLEEEQVIPALYLVWTGKPYDENCGITRISDLSASDVIECMNILDKLSRKIGENNKTGAIHKEIGAEQYMDYNYFMEEKKNES